MARIDKKREEVKQKTKIKICKLSEVNKDFTQIGNAAITLLDSEALHVYVYLVSRCMGKDYCFPSYDVICKDTGIHRTKIKSILNYLEDYQLILTRKRKVGTQFNNVYYIYAIKEIIDITVKDDTIIEKPREFFNEEENILI